MSCRSFPILLLLLAGCAATPRQPLDTRVTAERLEATRIGDPRVLRALGDEELMAPVGDETWDLDRMTLVAWALRPELEEARALKLAAEADLKVTGQRPNPGATLTSEFVRNAATGTSPWTIALAFSWLLENPQKRQARLDQAEARLQSAVWNEAQTVWQVRSEVRQAWVDWALAQLSRTQAEQGLTGRREFLQLTDTRVTAGSWPRPELERARASMLQAEVQLSQMDDALQRARAKLAATLGLTPGAVAEMPLQPQDFERIAEGLNLDWGSYQEAAVLNRLDLAQALAAYDQADAAWREQMSRRMPDFTLGPGYTCDRGDRKLVMGLGAEIPILANYDAAIAAATAQRAAAAQHVLVLQAQARASLEQVRVGLAGALRQLDIVTEARANQVRAEESARARWQAGIADRGTWLATAVELSVLERARLDALTRVTAELGALEDIVQQPVWPASLLLRVPANSKVSSGVTR